MNAIKTLLAVSAVLAAASSANAAVYTFNVTKNLPLATGGLTGINSGAGTGTLDTDTGVLTYVLTPVTQILYTVLENDDLGIPAGGEIGRAIYTQTDVIYGTMSGNTFTWTPSVTSGTPPAYVSGSSSTGSSCNRSGAYGGSICTGVAGGGNSIASGIPGTTTRTVAFSAVESSFVFNFGGVTEFHTAQAASDLAIQTATYTLTDTTPAVPVPAAAWLFGSGLLGLAGTARRRRAAAVAA